VGFVACRSARNLSYQDKLPVEGHAEELLQLKGQDLIGVPLKVRTSPPACSSLLLAALHFINLPLPPRMVSFAKFDHLPKVGVNEVAFPLRVQAPNSQLPRVFMLPLLTALKGKGNGIVTSMPPDAQLHNMDAV
jgi:hypothetical protein